MAFMSPDGRGRNTGAPFGEVSSGFGTDQDAPGDPSNFEYQQSQPSDPGEPSVSFSDGDLDLGDGGAPDFGGEPAPSLEDEGPGTDNGMQFLAPRPKADPTLGVDMQPDMPRSSGHITGVAEYWSTSGPHGNGVHGVQMLTDGEGHQSTSEIHSEHHQASKAVSHEHHEGASHHSDADSHGHKGGSSGAQSSKGHSAPKQAVQHHEDEHSREKPSAHRNQETDQDVNRKDDQRRQDRQEDQDRDGSEDPNAAPHPVIIISNPKDKPLNATAVVGGLVAIFAQAYLWGNVFVTIFKPQRQAAQSTMEAPAEGAASAVPNAETAAQGSPEAPESASSAPAARFSGASGQPGAHLTGAVAQS